MTGDIKENAKEAAEMYPNLLECQLILMPFMKNTHSATVALVNPAGVVNEEFTHRSSSFMLLLDPGNEITSEDISGLSRRLRRFLNCLLDLRGYDCRDKKFDRKTFKMHKPTGMYVRHVTLLFQHSKF
jgi:hypothetical protein